ncbi:high affinity copper uptake protein 1 isoform X2 [Cimex lectularius]|uniref:Copper transport protein n=1 Tax=Cimex lectularius TaxID=79782 RepID=A0A8I6RUC3_CIMLE|nr:high affinity copper uptake protein 1 isoform X2 [Cimex lectularius]
MDDHSHHDHFGHGDTDYNSSHQDHSIPGHDHSSDSHATHDHSSHAGHMMMMTFHFGYNEAILFDFWNVSTIAGFISSFIGIFVVSLIYEGIKYYREYLFWENLNNTHYKSVTNGRARSSSLPGGVEPITSPRIWSWFNAMQTMLHMLQMTISYLLMLIFMTFNVWLCLAVVLGSSTGYFFFGWKKTLVVDRNEHCH